MGRPETRSVGVPRPPASAGQRRQRPSSFSEPDGGGPPAGRVARMRRVSSGRGERGHPRPRQREGPDGYEFCEAGRSRHWEGWSRRSRRNRAETTRIPDADDSGPPAGRVAKKRRVSSGRGERGHHRPRQREGPDGYEFCGAGRCRHWEGWSRRSRRNRAETTRIPAADEGGPSAGRSSNRRTAQRKEGATGRGTGRRCRRSGELERGDRTRIWRDGLHGLQIHGDICRSN